MSKAIEEVTYYCAHHSVPLAVEVNGVKVKTGHLVMDKDLGPCKTKIRAIKFVLPEKL